MRSKNAQQLERKNFLILSLFLVLCLPLIVWQILGENFDIRNWAFQEVEVGEEYPCVISFPNVNPYTLEAGKTIRIQVEGIAQGSGITSVVINNAKGEEIFSQDYDASKKEIVENFEFTPSQSGEYQFIGTLSEGSYTSSCVISSPYDVKGIRAVANNKAPEFTSIPSNSVPSQDIETDVNYEYTLTATDPEADFINYSFSFTPNNDWLKYTVIDDGSNGDLKIQFKGSTSEPASYLANVFIHDGYSEHLRAQSWIISVDPDENDLPRVTILSPWEALTINQGDPLEIKWAATDRNGITNFELYLAESLQNEESWYPVDKDIAYDAEQYSIDTTKVSAGTYKAIIKANDNQDPPLVGRGVSSLIEVIGEEFDMPDNPDDKVQIPDPQVINVSPTNETEITNPLVTVRASLISSSNAKIDEDSIEILVDGVDVTSSAKLNKISDSEYTIIYQTETEYEGGLHKVEISFTDSNEREAKKSWTFDLITEEEDPDKIYIFGFGISKIIAYVVGGGLLLLILALIAPFILVKVWKEDETNLDQDDTLIPPQTNDTVEKLVREEDNINFSTLQNNPTEYKPKQEDLVPSSDETVPTTTQTQTTEPLYNSSSQDKNQVVEKAPEPQLAPPPIVPPEPVLPQEEQSDNSTDEDIEEDLSILYDTINQTLKNSSQGNSSDESTQDTSTTKAQ
jgi:hypothetical protein